MNLNSGIPGTSLQKILAQIENEYESLYLPWKLDLLIYGQIQNDELRQHIDRVGVNLYFAG